MRHTVEGKCLLDFATGISYLYLEFSFEDKISNLNVVEREKKKCKAEKPPLPKTIKYIKITKFTFKEETFVSILSIYLGCFPQFGG